MELLAIAVAFYGLLFGSFFNVLILRLPREQSIISPGSQCLSCGHRLAFFENIPLLSFLFLRGKCRNCKSKISLQYPIVEFATALFAVALVFVLREQILWAKAGDWWNFIEVFLQFFTLLLFLPIAIIDLRHYIIPDELTITGIVFALAISLLPDGITPLYSIIGAMVGGGFLLFAGILGKLLLKKDDAMGGGDIKLMFWLGAVFGWQAAVGSIFLGSFIGAIVGGFWLVLQKKSQNEKLIPFAPFLCLGMLAYLLFDEYLLRFVLGQ